MSAPVASGWSGRRVGLAPTGKAPPCHGARGDRAFADYAHQWLGSADNGHPRNHDRTVELGPQGGIRLSKGQGGRWSAATSPRRALDYSTTSVGLRGTAWDTL